MTNHLLSKMDNYVKNLLCCTCIGEQHSEGFPGLVADARVPGEVLRAEAVVGCKDALGDYLKCFR